MGSIWEFVTPNNEIYLRTVQNPSTLKIDTHGTVTNPSRLHIGSDGFAFIGIGS